MVVMVFEIDQDLYDKVTDVLAPQGLTLSDAIVLLFKKMLDDKEISLMVSKY